MLTDIKLSHVFVLIVKKLILCKKKSTLDQKNEK